MKRSELTQLTQIIEHIVAKEVRKQLPTVIAEVFQNMMGKKVVTEQVIEPPEPIQEEEIEETEEEAPTNLRASLRELFAGTPVIRQTPEQPQPRQPKNYTKNPVLNQILNETVSDLRQREGMVGMAAFQGGYAPAMAMMPGAATGPGEMMDESEMPSFARNMPVMPGPAAPPAGAAPVLDENHAPLSEIPEGVSALDVARQVPLAKPVAQALTRNYSQMMKLIDQKRGKA